MELRRDETRLFQQTAIDLFCGAGGFSLGLKDAGFRLLAALDNDAAARETFAYNFGFTPLSTDAVCTSGDDLLRGAGIGPAECTVVVGGPPCQGFSVQRRGDRHDARNDLVKRFLDIVLEIRPRFFVIENVGGLLSRHGREFRRYVEGASSSAGYRCFVRKLNAADFGVPQIRWRALVVGERADEGKTYFRFPQRTVLAEEYKTVRDGSLGCLPRP